MRKAAASPRETGQVCAVNGGSFYRETGQATTVKPGRFSRETGQIYPCNLVI